MQPLECCRASAPEGVKLAAATQDNRDAATLQGCATRSKVQMVSWEEGDFRYKVFPSAADVEGWGTSALSSLGIF